MDLSGPKVVASVESKMYTPIGQDEFHGIRGCTLWTTGRTQRKCSSNSSQILGQTVSPTRWQSVDPIVVEISTGRGVQGFM